LNICKNVFIARLNYKRGGNVFAFFIEANGNVSIIDTLEKQGNMLMVSNDFQSVKKPKNRVFSRERLSYKKDRYMYCNVYLEYIIINM